MSKQLFLAVSLLVSSTALAHEGAHGIVLDRMQMMVRMEQEMKVISKALLDPKPLDRAFLQAHVRALHEACHKVGDMFPSGSSDPHSHALPTVWERPHAFQAEMHRLHQASEALVARAFSSDRGPVLDAMKRLGATCQSCHETFRKPEP